MPVHREISTNLFRPLGHVHFVRFGGSFPRKGISDTPKWHLSAGSLDRNSAMPSRNIRRLFSSIGPRAFTNSALSRLTAAFRRFSKVPLRRASAIIHLRQRQKSQVGRSPPINPVQDPLYSARQSTRPQLACLISRLKVVQVIGPLLHHLAPLRQMHGPVIGTPQGITHSMCKLMLD